MCRYREEAWLRDRYHEEGLTQAELAEERGVSVRTIRRWMRRHGIETRTVEGEHHGLHGEERAPEVRERISDALTGRDVSEETRQRMSESHEGNDLNRRTRRRIAASLRGRKKSRETREKMSTSSAGDSNSNWKGGYSRRYGAGWSEARRAVRNRDEVCQHCGHDGSTHRLEVHHIVPVRIFRRTDGVELSDAHALENLVLLCKPCHGAAEHGVVEFSVSEDVLPDPIGEIYK